jgi:uncharacterized protein (TIGR03086 family)
MAADLLGMYERALNGANQLVSSVQPDELSRPTPCADWDVRALITHMIGTNRNFTAALTGEQPAVAPPAPTTSASELAAAYAAGAEAALAAWRAPGAMDRTLRLSFGEAPASSAVGIIFNDQLIHTWDLAKALGRPYRMDDDLATTAMELSQARMTPDRRGPGKPFGAEVPCAPDAPLQDRLAAFLGRQP